MNTPRNAELQARADRAFYDALGPEYTLLRFDPSVSVDGLLAAAAERRVPLALLDVVAREATASYEHALVIARPDQHVAWRGDRPPADPPALIDRLRGAAHE